MLYTQVIKPILLLALGCGLFSCSSDKKPAETIIQPELPRQVIEPANPYAVVDKSPMDISYYPVDYPKQLMDRNDSAALAVRVIYSRPHKMGRQIFGKDAPPKCIQQYGAYWRLGANEATEIEFFKPASIQGRSIPRGRYIIYCIPYETQWNIVLNSNLYSFGLHQDSAKDLLQFQIPVQHTADDIEYFTMVFQQSPGGANLVMAWGDAKAELPISF
ncbi:MAG: DUF2911 domain-containing protein [Ferruginibacter sp.]